MELIIKHYRDNKTKIEIMDELIKRGPLRRPLQKNPGRRVGVFPSRKMGRGVYWDGEIELTFIRFLEVRADVRRYLEQPLRISMLLDGKRKLYTPDFIIEEDQNLSVYEVKASYLVDEFTKIEELAKQILNEVGIKYKIITENDLPNGDYKNNIELILRYQDRNNSKITNILQNWPKNKSLKLGEIKNGILGELLSMADIVSLIGNGFLKANLHEKLENESQITKTTNPR